MNMIEETDKRYLANPFSTKFSIADHVSWTDINSNSIVFEVLGSTNQPGGYLFSNGTYFRLKIIKDYLFKAIAPLT